MKYGVVPKQPALNNKGGKNFHPRVIAIIFS